jgi:hypothetical protein
MPANQFINPSLVRHIQWPPLRPQYGRVSLHTPARALCSRTVHIMRPQEYPEVPPFGCAVACP